MEGWVSKMRLATNSVSAAYVRKAVRLGRGGAGGVPGCHVFWLGRG